VATSLSAEQIKLVERLADRKNLGTATSYDAGLTKFGKQWFCRRLAENAVMANASIGLSELERYVNEKIAAASVLIAEWRNAFESPEFPSIGPATTKERFIHRLGALQQVVACAIAIQPEMALSENKVAFKRIVSQRLRIWERMRFDVNPSGGLVTFAYPATSNAVGLNVDATQYWESRVAAGSQGWVLNDHGSSHSREAISSLFLQTTELLCNKLYCQHAAAAVLLDSLLSREVAENYDIERLAGQRGYFFVDTPYTQQPATNFLNDASSALFERVGVPLDDLQIGDHVFAESATYYELLEPEGLWSGEHTIVTSRFGRVPGVKRGTSVEDVAAQETVIEGLGLDHNTGQIMTVYNIRNSLLKHLNGALENARNRIREHWQANGETNGPDPGGAQDRIPLRADDPNSMLLWRNLEMERTLQPRQRLAVWFMTLDPGNRHYFWIVNPSAPGDIIFEIVGMDPIEVTTNDLTVEAVWHQRHPLLTEGGLVRVVRPRI
jgi:hypothetical protein